ncbi:MAG: hypothetical protein U0Q16_25030 [Bryobacteraceae bacterium]
MCCSLSVPAFFAFGLAVAAELDCESVREAGAGKPGVPFVGSLVRLVCEAAVDAAVTADTLPIPVRLVGLGVMIGGNDAPILAAAKLDARRVKILAQVPWQARTSLVNPETSAGTHAPRTVEVFLVRANSADPHGGKAT